MLDKIKQESVELMGIRDTVRRFVREEVTAEDRRRWAREKTWPREIFSKFAELGLCGLTVPESHGGAGVDIVAAVAVIEELASASGFIAGPYIHCAFYGGMNISEHGTNQQKNELLPRIASGDLFFAYGLSEPDVGGDLASVKTRGEILGDKVLINGTKRWCTGAEWVDYILCLVNSGGKQSKRESLSFVLIPKGTPGISITRLNHSNLLYTHSCDVHFDDVQVPVEYILGGTEMWGKGWKILTSKTLNVEKLEIAAWTFGLAQCVVDEAWRYSQIRQQFGKKICAHQVVQHKLVSARARLEVCRLVLYDAANKVLCPEVGAVASSIAKLFITETAVDIALDCQRILGAYGLSELFDMDQNIRDIIGMPIVGGSSDMQRNNLGALWGLPKY